jgi:hypothetical protein
MITERIMDRLRPGWRERAARRKSPWNIVCFLPAIALIILYVNLFMKGAWSLYAALTPKPLTFQALMSEELPANAILPTFLMMMPLFWPASVLGLFSANLIAWCIPPARRAMNREAEGCKELTFKGSNAGLIRKGGWSSVACLVISLVGILMLRSR